MVDDIKNMLDCEPFVAFRLILISGTALDVRSPYQVVFEEGLRISHYFAKTDRFALFGLFNVVAIETLDDDIKDLNLKDAS